MNKKTKNFKNSKIITQKNGDQDYLPETDTEELNKAYKSLKQSLPASKFGQKIKNYFLGIIEGSGKIDCSLIHDPVEGDPINCQASRSRPELASGLEIGVSTERKQLNHSQLEGIPVLATEKKKEEGKIYPKKAQRRNRAPSLRTPNRRRPRLKLGAGLRSRFSQPRLKKKRNFKTIENLNK